MNLILGLSGKDGNECLNIRINQRNRVASSEGPKLGFVLKTLVYPLKERWFKATNVIALNQIFGALSSARVSPSF